MMGMDEVYEVAKTTEFRDLTGIRFQSKERIPFCVTSLIFMIHCSG
jgi:hypothetical protein